MERLTGAVQWLFCGFSFFSVFQCENKRQVWQAITLLIISFITHLLIVLVVFLVGGAAYSRADANCDMLFCTDLLFRREKQTPKYWTDQRNYFLIKGLGVPLESQTTNPNPQLAISWLHCYSFWQTNLDFAHLRAGRFTVSMVPFSSQQRVEGIQWFPSTKTRVGRGNLETVEVAPFGSLSFFYFRTYASGDKSFWHVLKWS